MSSILGWWRERSLRREIAARGWAWTQVNGGEAGPPFGYSVGFDEAFGAPEMIVFSLPPQIARIAAERVGERLRAGEPGFAEGARWQGLVGEGACVWRHIHPTQLIDDYFAAALSRRREGAGERRAFTACQLVWPDEGGLFPWERGCAFQTRAEQVPLYEARDLANPDSWLEDIRREAAAP